jgi:DNA-binding response OmpR family regulator
MHTLILIEKRNVISEILKDSLSDILIKKITNLDEFWTNYHKINPICLILEEGFNDVDLFEFCQTIKEKYSLLLPILIVLNFFSSVDVEELRDLGVDYLVKPLNKDELIKKIESYIKTPDVLVTLKDREITSISEQSFEEIVEKIKPVIKEEVKGELYTLMKQFLEVLDRKDVYK